MKSLFKILLLSLVGVHTFSVGADVTQPYLPVTAVYAESIADVEGYGYDRNWSCTGSFVAQDIVLTARHCIEGVVDPENSLVVSVGLNLDRQSAKVSRIATQDMPRELNNFFTDKTQQLTPDFKESAFSNGLYRDLALLFLDRKLSLAKPLSLLSKVQLPAEPLKMNIKMAGFPEDSELRDWFRNPVPVSRLQACRVVQYSKVGIVSTCPSTPGSSGGPLLAEVSGQNYIIGTHSSDATSKTLGKLSVAVNLVEPERSDWIRAQIQDHLR